MKYLLWYLAIAVGGTLVFACFLVFLWLIMVVGYAVAARILVGRIGRGAPRHRKGW